MTPDHDLTVTNVPRSTDHTALKSYASGVEKRIGDIQRAAGELGGLRNVQVIIGTLVDERDAAKARVAELENAWKRLVSTEHAYVQGCSCPGCDPRAAADRIAELEGDLADAYRTEVERDRLRARVAELEGDLVELRHARDKIDRLRGELDYLHGHLETAPHLGDLADSLSHALHGRELDSSDYKTIETAYEGFVVEVEQTRKGRDRARSLLRSLTDAAAPYVNPAADASPDASHGQTMEADSALATAWRAARDHLVGALIWQRGEQADDGTVLVYRDTLALLAGTVDEWVPAAHRSEELAAVLADTTTALQAADAWDVEVVQTGGERL